jgi:two-component system, sensor histidine kinase and response regulator
MYIPKENNTVKILIVDDNPKNLQVLGSILRSNYFLVEFSMNGQGAINWLQEEKFDLILLDIMMPEMDGYETCRQIRNDKTNDNIPIIFLTAKTDQESIIKGFSVGGQDYITKPFDSEELLARVNTHLELKFSREYLKNINEVLEKQVSERTLELQKANEELSELDVVKVQFLNMLSHEIRTPLNGIKGSIHLLKSRIENEELVQFLNILDQSVIRLEQFSYTALMITRLNSRKYKLENVRIYFQDQVEYCLLELTRDSKDKKDIKINYDCLDPNLEIYADKGLIHEVLMRILGNSIKYTKEKLQVTFHSEIKDNFVKIGIEDNGPGFPEKILNSKVKMFNPGEKHINRNMGLNLYLSQLIISYHKGKMEISNIPGGGACVSLFFPK